jgi:predicted RNA methylase
MKSWKLLSLKIFSLLISVAVTVIEPSYAAWKVAKETSTHKIYIDRETLKQKGNKRFIWAMYDFHQAQPEGYRSVKVLFEVECKLNKYRLRMFTAFEESMGNGEAGSPRSSEMWEAATPDSIGAVVVQKVCPATP